MKLVFLFCALTFSLILPGAVSAQKKQRVRFAKGASSATVKGVVRGYDYIDYVIGARANQQISVVLTAGKRAPVFTVFQPGGDNVEGATEQDEFNCVIDKSGDYKIRVFMMRADARRKNSVAAFTLDIAIQ